MNITRRALVIDDDLGACEMVSRHLHNLKFETHYALTINEAQANVKLFRFDLILLDLNITDGSGIAIMRTLRDLHLHPKVIVSGRNSKAGKALAMGANRYITKPYDLQIISEALHALKLLPN
jgi:DNA-binding response OmpR family regulator